MTFDCLWCKSYLAGAPEPRPVASPIWQTSTFEFSKPEQVADAATETQPETFYTRYGHPNFSAVQEAIAVLEPMLVDADPQVRQEIESRLQTLRALK